MSDVVSLLKELSKAICAECPVQDWNRCMTLCWKHAAVNSLLEAYSFLGSKAYKSTRAYPLLEKERRGEK